MNKMQITLALVHKNMPTPYRGRIQVQRHAVGTVTGSNPDHIKSPNEPQKLEQPFVGDVTVNAFHPEPTPLPEALAI